MSYNFKNLSDVELVEEFPEGATELINDNGTIKQCPQTGGSGGAGNVLLELELDVETDEHGDTYLVNPFVQIDDSLFKSILEQMENGAGLVLGLKFNNVEDGIINEEPIYTNLTYEMYTKNYVESSPMFTEMGITEGAIIFIADVQIVDYSLWITFEPLVILSDADEPIDE